jgi:hypothetical protein
VSATERLLRQLIAKVDALTAEVARLRELLAPPPATPYQPVPIRMRILGGDGPSPSRLAERREYGEESRAERTARLAAERAAEDDEDEDEGDDE